MLVETPPLPRHGPQGDLTRAKESPDETAPAPAPPARATTTRLTSLDVFRGVTMVFMASEILRIPAVARRLPSSPVARFLAATLDHREWVGCAPWDLIQPAFMFMVGVALPFSIASRRARGHTFGRMFAHSVYRALMLIALGIFLRSQARAQTYFTFEDVLTQIGLGYVFLFLLAWTRPRVQLAAAALILFGYWAAFALYPLPAPGFDPTTVGVAANWPHHLTGFAAHWDKNTNLANAVDQWFLNLFPRERPFLFNRGGYLTLNFVPSLATMIFGLLAGGLLQRGLVSPTRTGGFAASGGGRPGIATVRSLVVWGLGGIVAGGALHLLGVCPIVKRIWTPSWTLYSGGWVVLLLAAFYYAIDLKGYRRWAFPFLVVGVNSIAMYVLVHVAEGYIARAFVIHLGAAPFDVFGTLFRPILLGASTLAVFWLVLFWMYRNRLFVRI